MWIFLPFWWRILWWAFATTTIKQSPLCICLIIQREIQNFDRENHGYRYQHHTNVAYNLTVGIFWIIFVINNWSHSSQSSKKSNRNVMSSIIFNKISILDKKKRIFLKFASYWIARLFFWQWNNSLASKHQKNSHSSLSYDLVNC